MLLGDNMLGGHTCYCLITVSSENEEEERTETMVPHPVV